MDIRLYENGSHKHIYGWICMLLMHFCHGFHAEIIPYSAPIFLLLFLNLLVTQQCLATQLRTSYICCFVLLVFTHTSISDISKYDWWVRWESQLHSNLFWSRDLNQSMETQFRINYHHEYRCVHPLSDCSSSQSSTKIIKPPPGSGNLRFFSLNIFKLKKNKAHFEKMDWNNWKTNRNT